MYPIAWHCPFCGHHASLQDQNVSNSSATFTNGNKYGTQWVHWQAISCPNPSCKEYTFDVKIHDYGLPEGASGGKYAPRDLRHSWQLVPAAQMKILPDYVPAPIVADYKEACLISDLSPKASATLSRRCLQGMIRDFWNVNKGRLVDEIEAIKDNLDELAWSAIDGLRKMGNIGAHMEKDINVIVDVDPNEAKLLIGLIETLIDDWYVVRHERMSRMERLVESVKEKFQKTEPSDK